MYTVHSVHCTLCTLYIVYTVHSVHCTQCTVSKQVLFCNSLIEVNQIPVQESHVLVIVELPPNYNPYTNPYVVTPYIYTQHTNLIPSKQSKLISYTELLALFNYVLFVLLSHQRIDEHRYIGALAARSPTTGQRLRNRNPVHASSVSNVSTLVYLVYSAVASRSVAT